jgi:hypothetical protein
MGDTAEAVPFLENFFRILKEPPSIRRNSGAVDHPPRRKGESAACELASNSKQA